MSLDENITLTLKDLPPNILFIPIFQSSQSPHSHHQKGAVFIGKKKTTLIWNASNFRRYETHKLVDIGITITDSQLANIFTQRWINTAFTSCSEVKTINCNLQTRFSNSPKELDFWKSMTDRNCQQLPDAGKPLAKTLNAEDLILDLISKAKKTIYVHTHIFGNSLILKKFKEAQARGIDVKIIGGKPSTFNPQLPWVKFKLEKHEYHAKFMLFDDTTFIWGTGNITKSSLNNHREDFFYGSNPKILSKLKKYFEMSWH